MSKGLASLPVTSLPQLFSFLLLHLIVLPASVMHFGTAPGFIGSEECWNSKVLLERE